MGAKCTGNMELLFWTFPLNRFNNGPKLTIKLFVPESSRIDIQRFICILGLCVQIVIPKIIEMVCYLTQSSFFRYCTFFCKDWNICWSVHCNASYLWAQYYWIQGDWKNDLNLTLPNRFRINLRILHKDLSLVRSRVTLYLTRL